MHTADGPRPGCNLFAGSLAELVRLLKPYIDKEDNRVGAKLISGGVY